MTARCEEAADLAEAVLSGGILDRGEALARADVLLELVGAWTAAAATRTRCGSRACSCGC